MIKYRVLLKQPSEEYGAVYSGLRIEAKDYKDAQQKAERQKEHNEEILRITKM